MRKNPHITDKSGRKVAEIVIDNTDEGWYHGSILHECFLDYQKEALQWYDEVVTEQMLSYFDESLAIIDGLGLHVHFSEINIEPVHSMHMSKDGKVSFRTTPVPSPPTS